ncbi:hypothetical protein [Methylocystis echinoides]|uniref:hypothetical protein n=1 Tax=Methylocystis echinoides TaxID=29468 RepID=UPI0034154923
MSALLFLGAVACTVSGTILAIATWKAAEARDWEAARIGIALTLVCLIFAGGLGVTSIVLAAGSRAFIRAILRPSETTAVINLDRGLSPSQAQP